MARLGVGLREHRVQAGHAGVRDEALRPVQDVLSAVAPGRRPHRGSDPEPASVKAYAASTSPDASRGNQAERCSSVPPSFSPSEPSSCTARISPLVAQTFETSSIATRDSRVPVPVPPTSSSNRRPKIPWSRKSSTTSHGNSCDASISAARGAIRSRASVRTWSRSSRCSPVRTSQGTAGGSARSASAGTNLLTSTILSAGTFARRAASTIASGDGAS